MKYAILCVIALLCLAPVQAAEPGNAAQLTVRWSTATQQLEATTDAIKTEGSTPGPNVGESDVIRLDPYGNTGLPRSLRIVFEELPPGADGCGVVWKPGSRPQFKGFITSVSGKHVLMLTNNTGSEYPQAFSIVCYDELGRQIAELDPGADDENPGGDWP